MKPLKNKLAVTIVVLSVAFFGIILFSLKSDSNGITSGIGTVISPLQNVVYKVNNRVKETVDFFLNFSTVKSENESLKAENTELQNKLIEYNTLKEENDTLREALNFTRSKDKYDYLGANVIGYSGSSLSDGYIIDVGTEEGIKKGMVAITAKGLVGKVTKAASHYSIVQTILNENIAVSVVAQGANEDAGVLQGITSNKNKGLTQIYNLPIDSSIKEGDIILTSGLGEIYPKDIPVGVVSTVDDDKVKVMKRAVVKPYADLNSLEELMIVIPKNSTDEVKYD